MAGISEALVRGGIEGEAIPREGFLNLMFEEIWSKRSFKDFAKRYFKAVGICVIRVEGILCKQKGPGREKKKMR